MLETNDKDWALVDQVRRGRDAAFDALMVRYKYPVLDFIYRMTGDAEESRDLAQVVFVRAYRAIMGGRVRRRRGAFSTWLFQIARNAALDALRYQKRHPTVSRNAEQTFNDPPGRERTAPETLEARELGRHIAAAIADLPTDQRAAIVLSEYNGLDSQAIADILKCSRKGVENRLYRARQTLRRRLAAWR